METLNALEILANASDDVCGEITMLEVRDYVRGSTVKNALTARIKSLESAAAILDRAYEYLRKPEAT